MPATPKALASKDELNSLAQDLETGVGADVWYDAAQHDDEEAAATIERTQNAMEKAARLLRALAEAS